MESLFDDFNNIYSGAVFSSCGKYRLVLWRKWDLSKPNVMFIGLNPSIADAKTDDPTIRRLISFAKAEGFGGFYMLNLFTLISTDPRALLTVKNTDYLANDYLYEYQIKTDQIVFAWGSNEASKQRAREVINMFPSAYCFGKNKDGSPKHPLYLLGTTKLIKF
jgi:hypothetical protein